MFAPDTIEGRNANLHSGPEAVDNIFSYQV